MTRFGLIAVIAIFALMAPPHFSAQAQPIDRYILPGCSPTPSMKTFNYPGFTSMVTGNNLVQPAGKSVPAEGQRVTFQARVFDNDCVPVSQAKVEFWQADAQGRHRFATAASLATPDPVFTGNGRTTTDNLGQFQFITLYPAPFSYTIKRGENVYEKIYRAPHFNLRITHPDMREFHANLFFAGDSRNGDDYYYKRLNDSAKPRVLMQVLSDNTQQGALQAYYDIVLPYKAPFRRF